MVGQATHCDCRRLHAGTRVYISSDVGNVGLRNYLATESAKHGLACGGQITNQTQIYVTGDPSVQTPKLLDARSVGALAVDRADYERMLDDVCRRGLDERWVDRKVPIRGKKVYLLLKNTDVQAELGALLRRSGAEIGERIYASLGAAVVSPQREDDGEVILLRARDVPVFRLEVFRRLYG